MKNKTHFVCQSCGAVASKWLGRCNQCNQWNTLVEESVSHSTRQAKDAVSARLIKPLSQVMSECSDPLKRIHTKISELDRVLCGGFVKDSVVLLGGQPGIGKSTLLLQVLAHIEGISLYLSAEESLEQIAARAARLAIPGDRIHVVSMNDVNQAIEVIKQEKPQMVVIDSLQTFYDPQLDSAPGSVGQVREVAHRLVELVKQQGTILLLVGQINKEGLLAGPKVVEHLVDVVLYFDVDLQEDLRLLSAHKNRYGTVSEVGIFEMTERGLFFPSALNERFLSKERGRSPGAVATAQLAGSRPFISEIQALAVSTAFGMPRRTAIGFDHQRLAMLLAVLERHAGISTLNHDVFANVVGGIKLSDTSSDLAILMAVASSIYNKSVPKEYLAFGEIGLTGEVNPVKRMELRIEEAKRMGFQQIICPLSRGIACTDQVVCVKHVKQVVELIMR